jgi:hypothetical protein
LKTNITSAAFLSALIFLVALTPAWAMSRSDQNARIAASYEGVVTRIDAPLRFTLDCCDGVLLEPGMVEVSDTSPHAFSVIERVLRAHRWTCTSFANTTPEQVWCNAEDGTLMGKMLLDQGVVREICTNSGNQFGTC